MDKSPEAFRTISEVAEMLGTPAHVLRFWESRFPQIRPVKRAGGRRYYRPADVMLLTGIKTLLHDQGMTIRGVQKILREQGVRHIAALSGGEIPEILHQDSVADLEQALTDSFGISLDAPSIEVEPETATIIALETALRQPPAAPQAEPDLPEALAAAFDATPDLPTEQPSEMANLFDILNDDADPQIAETELASPDPGEADNFDAETAGSISTAADEPGPIFAPETVAPAAHPLEYARRLRQVKPARLRLRSAQLRALQARLAALHATLGPAEPIPSSPLN